MKIKQFFKKAAAMVMAAVTVLSLLPATAFAATGDVGTISFTHTYDSAGNVMHYNSSAVINGYTAGGTGKNKYRMYVDGSTAFCIQPGVPLKTGNKLTENSSETWNALSASQKKAVGLALLYGYQGNRDSLTGSDDEKWLATQTLVWEFVTGCRNATGSFAQTDTTVYTLHFGSNYPNSGAAAAYDQIVSALTKHNKVPSFMNGSSRELEYKDGQYVLTLADTNGVLSEYSFSSSDRSVNISKSGNTLTISSTNAFSGTVQVTATRNNIPVVSESAKLIAYGDPDLQDLVTGVENADDVTVYNATEEGSVTVVEVTKPNMAQKGIIKVSKSGEMFVTVSESDGIYQPVYAVQGLPGAVYEITAAEDVVTPDGTLRCSAGDVVDTITTGDDGLAESKPLYLGKYEICEITAPYGMVLNTEVHTAELVYAGQEIEITETSASFYNERQKAAISLDKVMEQNEKFSIGMNGEITAVTFGLYANEELTAADGSAIPADGMLEILSVNENGHAICKTDLPFGNYYLKEIATDNHYILSDTEYPVVFEYKTCNDSGVEDVPGLLQHREYADEVYFLLSREKQPS